MIEVKPSNKTNTVLIVSAILVAFLIYYFSRDLYFSGSVLILVLAGTAINSRSRILLDNGILTYTNVLGKKSILVEKIDSIKLRSGAKQVILVFFTKKDELGKSELLRVYNVGIYKRVDLKGLLNEITRINPSIVISDQARNLIDGKFYMVTSFKDA